LLLWPLTLLASLTGPESGQQVPVQIQDQQVPVPIQTEQVPVQAEPEPAWSGDLSLVQEYRLRTAGPGPSTPGPLGVPVAANPRTDQDLHLMLDGLGSGYHDHLQGQISAALWIDLDGYTPAGQPDLFAQPSDYLNPLFVVYALSAEWRRSLPFDYLRLGRQASEHGLPITFDGASASLRLWERQLSLFGYAGRTVHFFEVQPSLFESWVACTGATYRASENLRFEADTRLEHDTVLSQDAREAVWVYANSYGLTMSTRIEDGWAKLFARGLDRKPSHAGGVLHLGFPSIAAGIDAQVTAQLRTLGEISENESPFYTLLGPSLPNFRSRLELWKEIAVSRMTNLSLRAGWRIRQLLSGVEGPFNRNAGDLYFQAEVNNLGLRGLFATGILEWNYIPWSLTNSAFMTVGGSAGYTARRVKVEAGTYYQRWKINYYRDVEELQDARTVYGMASVRPLRWLEVRARYNLEIVDRAIHTVFFSLREDF
jgi:hypothetical protein